MHTCDICKKQFDRAFELNRHKNRKNPCKKQLLQCDNCNATFTYKSALVRHQKSRCAASKIKTVEDVNNEEILLLQKMKEMKVLKLKIMQNKINDKINDEIKDIDAQIQLKQGIANNIDTENISSNDTSNDTTNGTTNNIQNNITNNNNNTINQNIQIINVINTKSKIKKFGEEDLSYITDDEYITMFEKGLRSPYELVTHVHFNKNQPQNHNVYVSNMRSNVAKVHDGKQWIVQPIDTIVDKLIDDSTTRLDEAFEKLEPKISDKVNKKYKKFQKRQNDDDVVDDMKKTFVRISYDNHHIIKCAKNQIEN